MQAPECEDEHPPGAGSSTASSGEGAMARSKSWMLSSRIARVCSPKMTPRCSGPRCCGRGPRGACGRARGHRAWCGRRRRAVCGGRPCSRRPLRPARCSPRGCARSRRGRGPPWTGSNSRPHRPRRRPRRRRRASSSCRTPSCGRGRARPRGCGRASLLVWVWAPWRALGGVVRGGVSAIGVAGRGWGRLFAAWGRRQTPSSSQRGLRKSLAMRRRCDDIATKKRSASGASSGPLRR